LDIFTSITVHPVQSPHHKTRRYDHIYPLEFNAYWLSSVAVLSSVFLAATAAMGLPITL